MFKSKSLTIFTLFFVFIFAAGAQKNCDSKKNKNSPANTGKTPIGEKTPAEDTGLKTLAEGFDGLTGKPFLFVVRSPETYKELQSLMTNLPPAGEIDFKKQTVVAAFASTKNTGGYSVAIKKSGEKITVSVVNPPADALVTQALTMPYKIVSVPVSEGEHWQIELSEEWQAVMETYRITSGEFRYSGGLRYTEKKFAVEGEIRVLRFGDYTTFFFEMKGKDDAKERQLAEIASGTARGGNVDLLKLDAGSFSENPKPPLKVSGTVSDNKLSLNFEPNKQDYMVNDGYETSGKIAAVKAK